MASRQASGAVVSQIETVLEPVLRSLSLFQTADLTLASKQNGVLSFETIRFPGRSVAEAKRFARVILILQLAHDSVVSGNILTKRNVFYQNQNLFSDQTQVDSLVDAVALTLAVRREDLNIVATSKGVLVGPSVIHLSGGQLLDLTTGDSGTPVPLSSNVSSVNLINVRWVLVVEKDAVFRTLCSTRYWERSTSGHGLVITAKGYPDLITRDFLQLVNLKFPNLPILTLMDYDVDGMNIARCYRYSTDPTSRNEVSINPGISWLGIRTEQVISLASSLSGFTEMRMPGNSDPQSSQGTSSTGSVTRIERREPISHLTLRDRKVAVGILDALSTLATVDVSAADLMEELQQMLMLGIKCEIQWLDECGNIGAWLDQELQQICIRE